MFEIAYVEPNMENLKKVYEQYFDKDTGKNVNYSNRYIVVMLWINEINGGMDKRSGSFEEYYEATLFKDMLKETGDRFGYPYAILMNGSIVVDGGFQIKDTEDKDGE